ncbi:hypothetical protein V865_002815 [Kwoniella europaea PYCC6329]|uniref:ASX DEUBAD domain-containing protein n=1 Tax=Kwoniella europaea PYCC6329 TaxID=1423913 RepID=A0AAX4KFD2_9TREE
MAENALPLDPYSSDDNQEEDASEVARQERRVERENLISEYGWLTSSQRDVVRDPSASVGSAILAFSRDPPSFSRDWEEDSIWGVIDYDQLTTALQYKNLTTHTRDSLLAAPIQSFLDKRCRTKYALDCKSFVRFYSRGCPQSTRNFWLPRRESMNLDLNDSRLAEGTLRDQLASSQIGGIELSEEGMEIILEVIPDRTRAHAEDNWRLISDAHSRDLIWSSRRETLALEKENRMRLFNDWKIWRERGSRERWLDRQIEKGNWEHIAPWSSGKKEENSG